MRISTITCHDVYNYGASLQAYALQAYLQSLGYNYQIIDYKPPYLSNHHRLGAIDNQLYDKPIVKQLYLIAKLPGRLRQLKRKRKFDKFTSSHLNISHRRYASCEELSEDCPVADLYIAGSDQIWNTLFRNGKDPSFYLDFVGNRGRKISYAASFATDRIYDNAQDFVCEKLKNFDAISVREESALNLLQELNRYDGVLVADPVFLLNRDSWDDLTFGEREIQEDYILVYDCERSKKLRTIATDLKRQTDLKIYTLSPTCGRFANRNFELSGPIEFLHLIKNARYIVANSFHALAFSLIYKKDFFIINRSEGINSRMRDFLHFLGLDNRLIDAVSDVTIEPIDYSAIESKISCLIEQSTEFLAKQIEDCERPHNQS